MQFTTTIAGIRVVETLLSIKQRYKLNAIHNEAANFILSTSTVVNKAKIQIECNSQLDVVSPLSIIHCCQ